MKLLDFTMSLSSMQVEPLFTSNIYDIHILHLDKNRLFDYNDISRWHRSSVQAEVREHHTFVLL